MANVAELFSRFFAYILLLEEAIQQGQPQRPYEQIRREIAALLDQQQAAAKRLGMSDRDYQDACFAAVAWADEILLKQTTWEHHSRWNAAPLQLEYFQTRNAGEELFERLERLRPEQKDLREIYFVALGLGFTGRYFLGLEDELKLTQIRHEQAKQLALAVDEVQDLDKLTPQPYTVTPPAGAPMAPSLLHRLVKISLLLVVVVPLAVFLAYKLWQTPSPVVTPPEPVLTVADIERHIGVQSCARVSVGLRAGLVELGGRVADEAQRTEVRSIVQRIQGVKQVNDTLQVIPKPFCQVLDLLEPYQRRGEEQRFGLAATLNKPGEHPIYLAGDNLIIDIKAPSAFDSYLYVDFYTLKGEVAHLFPNPVESRHFLPSNGAYTVGKMGDPQRLEWKIQPPYGLELVTVIASKTPLFDRPRYDVETVDSYLNELRRALPKDLARADVAATVVFITTRNRD
jgi:type IV/VI secretion system ImpK/VasF family protein